MGEINSDQRVQLFLIPHDDAPGLFTLQSERAPGVNIHGVLTLACPVREEDAARTHISSAVALLLAAERRGSRWCENNQLFTSERRSESLRPKKILLTLPLCCKNVISKLFQNKQLLNVISWLCER